MRRRYAAGWLGLGLGLALSFTAGTVSAHAFQAGEEDEQRAFSIPERTEALRRAREVESHIAARRWPQAIQTLQDLMEHDGNAVLPEAYRPNPDLLSVHPVFPGAGDWARKRLLSLPREAVDIYRQRFRSTADDALAAARQSLDQNQLVKTAERWPLCDAAPRALWILGELELEAGHAKMALLAWRQAIDAFKLIQPEIDGEGNPRIEALEKRCSMITERLAAERRIELQNTGSAVLAKGNYDPLRSEDESQTRAPLPSKEAKSWYTPIDMWPYHTRSAKVLFPTEHRGKVLVSTSFEVYCFDAFTGRELWRTEKPEGWEQLRTGGKEDLMQGLYREMLQIQPVVSGRVAVAALQMPYSAVPNEQYRNMKVKTAIPERRLFAFDLDSGAQLWNHAPEIELKRRGEFSVKSVDTYAQSMMIAATPTIVGSRILVPSYLLEGRIDYQVACYELESGRLLWKTNLISGQRSRNMFGHTKREFCSSPLVVSGGRVIAQTDLGAVAALDLSTGRILWESLYKQIPAPPPMGFSTRPRRLTWETCRPVVQGDLIISAPADSDELYCFNLEDGRILWSYAESSLSRRSSTSPFNTLLGVDKNTVYLGGAQVAALSKTGGLGDPTIPFRTLWYARIERTQTSPPQLLCKAGILISLSDGRVMLDRAKGKEIKSLTAKWDRPGTPLVSDGILITLGGDGLRGFFDWKTLLAKQNREYSKNPNNYEVALATAQLFSRRAEAALLEDETFVSLDYIGKARMILERASRGADQDARTGPLLHQVLCSEAKALMGKGDKTRALVQLRRARQLAPHGRALRDTLLQEERILRESKDTNSYLGLLATLLAECGPQPLPEPYLAESFVLLEVDERFRGRKPTIELWVMLRRAAENLRNGELAAVFEDWTQLLKRHGEFQIQGQSVGELVSKRMAQLLSRSVGRKAYAPFEKQAQALLLDAKAAMDLSTLDRLTRHYPHSVAAKESDEMQVEWAYGKADSKRLAGIVHGPRAAELKNNGRDALLRLAHLLGQAGNKAYERGMLQRLLRDAPKATSNLSAYGSRPLAEVLDDLLAQVPAKREILPQFRGDISARRTESGKHYFLGSMQSGSPSASSDLHVYAAKLSTRSESPQFPVPQGDLGIMNPINLVAFSGESPDRAKWHIVLEDEFHIQNKPERVSLTRTNRLVVAGRNGIHALDSEGQMVWEYPRRELQADGRFRARSITERDGILVAWMQHREDTHHYIVRAFDLEQGTPLWQVPLEQKSRTWYPPILGDNYVVLPSKEYKKPGRVHVIDLFLGTTISKFELSKVESPFERTSWILGDQLFVPAFKRGSRAKESIRSFDLLSGRELESQSLPERMDLRNIVHYAGETYVVMSTSQTGYSGGTYLFKPRSRSLRRILPLSVGEVPMGMDPNTAVTLRSREMYLANSDSTRGLLVRALDLEAGRVLWSRSFNKFDTKNTAVPIVSDDYVAMVIKHKKGRTNIATLALLDRSTGEVNLKIDLNSQLGKATRYILEAIGESIFILGSGSIQRSELLEIINTSEESR